MKIQAGKVLGTLVKVVNYDSSYEEILNYNDDPWAFPFNTSNWQDYAYSSEYWHCEEYVFIPTETLGLIVGVSAPYHGVTMNFVKVLFPATKFDKTNDWHANTFDNPAGAYWISGDFLEEVDSDE